MSTTYFTPARIAIFATAFAFCVIVFGAFVRLSNAGLSCPDWPTCYGQITWPKHEGDVAAANEAFPDRPFESTKAWREQVHRFLAGGLIVATFALAWMCWRRRDALGKVAWIPPVACVIIVFQALLGMWTVTLLLKPIVVMGHLLGGLTTFALLGYTALALMSPARIDDAQLRRFTIVALVLLACQIALGGWTSANYAALACGFDFPHCQGQWWPAVDFKEGFVLWRGIGVNYEGGVLDAPARAAIQIAHRIGALVVFCYLAWLAWRASRAGLRRLAGVLGVLLVLQVSLGIGNVKLGLPLPVATAHNGVAALLLLTLLAVLVRVRAAHEVSSPAAREKMPTGR